METLNLKKEYKQIQKSETLKHFRNKIPFKWTIEEVECYFFNADLFLLFETVVEKRGIKVNDFAPIYKNGFKAGLSYLKEEEEIDINNFRSKDLKEGTIESIKQILYHREFSPFKKGILKTVFHTVPLIFNEKNIYNYGYWNAIVYSLDKLFEKAGLQKLDLLNSIDSNFINSLDNAINNKNNSAGNNTDEGEADSNKQNSLSKIIENAFSFMLYNDPRKHKQIINDTDFASLITWITHYFENNFTIPQIDEPIKVINTNKGNVVYTFIKIFKDLHPTKTRPDSLFELIKKCFYEYRNDKISN